MASQINPQLKQRSHFLACFFTCFRIVRVNWWTFQRCVADIPVIFWRYALKDAVFQHASETLLLQGLYSVIWQSANLICTGNLLPVYSLKLLRIFIGIVGTISQQSAILNKSCANITFRRHIWRNIGLEQKIVTLLLFISCLHIFL